MVDRNRWRQNLGAHSLSNLVKGSANSYRHFDITMPFPLARSLPPSMASLERPSSMQALLLAFLLP